MLYNSATGILCTSAKEVPNFSQLVAYLRGCDADGTAQQTKFLIVNMCPSPYAADIETTRDLSTIITLVCALRCTDINIDKLVVAACKTLSHEDQKFIKDLAALVALRRRTD